MSVAQSVRLLSWSLGLVSVGSFSLAESSSAPEVRLVLVTIACLSFAWSGPLTLIAGAFKFGREKFSFFQPFHGGSNFVALQALGWALFAICCGFSLLVLVNIHSNDLLPGELSALGVFGFVSTALLNLSLDSFSPDVDQSVVDVTDRTTKGKRNADAAMYKRWKVQSLKTLVCTLISLAAYFALVLVDLGVVWQARARQELAVNVATMTFVLCGITAHVLCGCVDMGDKGYRFLQPFVGGQAFQLLQAIGWTFFSSILFVYIHTESLVGSPVRGALSLYGASGFVSTLLLVVSLRYFQPVFPEVSQEANMGGSTGMFFFASVAVQLICLVYITVPSEVLNMLPPIGDSARTGVALVGPLVAHVASFLMLRDQGYQLFQPLQGGQSFILAQAFGWSLYGIVLFEWLMSLNALNRSAVRIKPLSIIASLLIHSSVRVFQGTRAEERKGEVCSVSTHTLKKNTISKRFYASDALAWVAVGTSFVLDVTLYMKPSSQVIAHRLLEVCIVLWFANKAALYWAAFGKRLVLWRPFHGPDIFVMCEAVSWTLFVIAAVAHFIILNAFHSTQGHVQKYSFVGWSSSISMANLFSHFVLRYGSVFRLRLELRKKTDNESPQSDKERAQLPGKGLSLLFAGVLAHATFAFFAFVDLQKQDMDPDAQQLYFGCGVILPVVSSVVIQTVGGPRNVERYKMFQPFRGGAQFVMLQAIGWTIFAITLALAFVCLNVGVQNVAIPGIITSLGAAFYASQMILLYSLRFFQRQRQGMDVSLDERLGVLLGAFALVLFVFTDFAVIRFGLPVTFIQPIIASAWVAACASVPLSAFVLVRAKTRARTGLIPSSILELFTSPTMVLVGCALWSFTILLGALLVVNSILNNNYISVVWAATLAGASNLVSHLALSLASVSNTKELLSLLPVAVLSSVVVWIFVRVFVWFILPLLRGFLDYPMHVYAVLMKRTEGWLSPDGLQALKNIHLERGIRYGPGSKDRMDIVRPLDINRTHVRCIKEANQGGPILYCHGGGHLCVTSEILLHSMTPFARASLTVYSVEYPLSPDTRFPFAVLSLVRAILWVGCNHCPNIHCQPKCVKSRISNLQSHECDSSCGVSSHAEFSAWDFFKEKRSCKHCGATLGVPNVQLVGDSAGGSLVSMATALLYNPELFKRTVKLAGEPYADLLNVPEDAFPAISRLVALYGLLGRHTPLLMDEDDSKESGSWLWNLICHVGISFVFKLYDSNQTSAVASSDGGPFSSLTDLGEKDLVKFAPETMLICGADDPLLPSNRAADKLLGHLGHKCELHVVPGTHAFHGFPVNWMHYLGADWTINSLPATLLMLQFFSGKTLDQATLEKLQADEVVRPDYTPFVIFPAFFFLLPILVVSLATQLSYYVS